MSLVKFEGSLSKPVWGGNNGRRRTTLPKIEDNSPPPTIDYEKLRWLCSIDGLKGKNQEYTTKEAHDCFMTSYRDVFVKPPKKLGFPVHAERRGDLKSSTASITHKATGKTTEDDSRKVVHKKEYPIDKITHDIRDYLPLLHKQRKSEHPEAVRADNIKTLRKLLRKLPFERTASDNDKIFSILKTFKFFQDNTPDNVLKELCVVAVFEQWKEVDFTVFGNTGLHMVLKGAVAQLTDPVLNGVEPCGITSRSATPLLTKEPNELIKPGEFFGTLKSIEGRDKGSKIFSVVTKEQNCEFLKISSSDYTRVVDRIEKREHTEKINLLLACGQYKLWPQQPLHQVAELFEWISYPPNTESSSVLTKPVKRSLGFSDKENMPSLISQDGSVETVERLSKIGLSVHPQTIARKLAQWQNMLDSEIIRLKESWANGSSLKYQLVGDNWDKNILPSYRTSDRKTVSLHLFNMYAIVDRVIPQPVSGYTRTLDVSDLDPRIFIPSIDDQEKLMKELIFIFATAVISNNEQMNKFFGDIYPRHLEHPKSQYAGEKTVQYPLGLFDCNENKTKEMIRLLKHLSATYVPQMDGEMVESVFLGVLVSEGYKAPYIAFIKSGECHVLRQVDVIQTLRNLKREKKTKQVVMGKLVATQSFAEISVLLDEPITCSIVTATNVELGIIRPERIQELDEVTKQLFQQSNVRTFGDLSQDDIQQEYIKQELKREWNEFKHKVVVESINAQGIRPGYGKWAK